MTWTTLTTAATLLGLKATVLGRRILLVALGGAVGSVLRYLVGLWAGQTLDPTFPWGTMSVNIVGCFMIGALATLADEVGVIGPEARTLLIVGVLGGFTTFSSFALETQRLIEAKEMVYMALYVAGSLGISFLATLLGIGLIRLLYR